MSSPKFTYSNVVFKTNPGATSCEEIHLGYVIEFATSDYWAVGLAVRSPLPTTELAGLDPLSRELLENSPKILDREVAHAVSKASKVGDVVRYLAHNNPWSISISSPKVFVIERDRGQTWHSANELLEGYAISLFRQEAAPDRRNQQMPESDVIATPPAWMLPPKCWITPFAKSA